MSESKDKNIDQELYDLWLPQSIDVMIDYDSEWDYVHSDYLIDVKNFYETEVWDKIKSRNFIKHKKLSLITPDEVMNDYKSHSTLDDDDEDIVLLPMLSLNLCPATPADVEMFIELSNHKDVLGVFITGYDTIADDGNTKYGLPKLRDEYGGLFKSETYKNGEWLDCREQESRLYKKWLERQKNKSDAS